MVYRAWGRKAPNSKHQITNKLQLPNFEIQKSRLLFRKRDEVRRLFKIEIWELFGIWNL
jgi:hypothetical protein